MSTVAMRISMTSSTTSTLPRRSGTAMSGAAAGGATAPRAVPAKTLRSFRASSSLR